MSAQSVLPRLNKFIFSLPFQTATTQILYALILKIVREIINYRLITARILFQYGCYGRPYL